MLQENTSVDDKRDQPKLSWYSVGEVTVAQISLLHALQTEFSENLSLFYCLFTSAFLAYYNKIRGWYVFRKIVILYHFLYMCNFKAGLDSARY